MLEQYHFLKCEEQFFSSNIINSPYRGLSLGPIRNFSMEQGSPELIPDYGATKGPAKRPRYIGAVRAQS